MYRKLPSGSARSGGTVVLVRLKIPTTAVLPGVLLGFKLRSLPPVSSLRALLLRLDESRRGPLIAIVDSGTERGRVC